MQDPDKTELMRWAKTYFPTDKLKDIEREFTIFYAEDFYSQISETNNRDQVIASYLVDIAYDLKLTTHSDLLQAAFN